MKQIAIVAALGAALLAGCASSPQQGGTASTPAPAAATAAPAAQPVAIPAASAKRLVLHMTGPKNVVDSSSWASFKDEWRSTFADHAKQAGVAFSMQEGDARPTGEPGTHVTVHVNDFRQVGIGSRIFLGVMTGNAYIDARASFADLRNGAVYGTQAYNTTSSAWHGVFGKMTPQQVDAIATTVFQQLKSAR